MFVLGFLKNIEKQVHAQMITRTSGFNRQMNDKSLITSDLQQNKISYATSNSAIIGNGLDIVL